MIRRPLRCSAIKRKSEPKKRKKSELSAFKKKLWPKFAKYIKDLKGNDCISCDRKGLVGKDLHAGHMLSAGTYPGLKWEVPNVNPQCSYDNIFRKGNYLEYRERFIAKHGQEEYDKLWNRRHDARQYRLEDLQEIDRMIDKFYEEKASERASKMTKTGADHDTQR